MKKSIILVLGMILMMSSLYSQTSPPWTENFDGNVTFTAKPAGSWIPNTMYYHELPGSSTTNPKSYWAEIPNRVGDSIILETDPYNCTPYEYVMLKFSHICKVSPLDIVRIEYRTGGSNWEAIPEDAYMGTAAYSPTTGFNAESYPEWQANDSTVLPAQSWWKEEIFDLRFYAGKEQVQFRFMLIHGQQAGTQASYGWLLDNFQLLASTSELYPPKIAFMGDCPKDTVFSVGPYTVNALVKTETNASLKTPVLVYTSIENGVSQTDSCLMTHVEGDSLWSVTLPAFVLGTEVSYSIKGEDTLGNSAILTSYYTIQKPPQVSTHGDIIIGTGTSRNYYSPYYPYYDRSWTRTIYYGWEFNPQQTGSFIKSIAYNTNTVTPSFADQLSMYVKPTKDTVISVNGYVDPILEGATLVWGENSYTTHSGWNEFTFRTPFYLPPGYHLMVYWIHNDGNNSTNYSDSPSWYHTAQSVNNHIRAYQNGNPNISTLTNVSLNTLRPNIKATLLPTDFPSNSGALVEINSPVRGQTTGGVSTPITITLKNKGVSVLTSAAIKWTVNNGAVKTLNWQGNLPWDYQQQVIIDSNYIPSMGAFDTILIWVSMPNGVSDASSYDDSLSIITYGCDPNAMTSVYTVGTGGDFKTIEEAIRSVSTVCPTSGKDIILKLKSGTYAEGIDLRGLSLSGTFTITSDNTNNKATIKPSSSSGIILAYNKNIIIKDIKINVTGRRAIEFTKACTNIVIRDCELVANGCNNEVVYFASAGYDSIFIVNNSIKGGYAGIYTNGGNYSNSIIDNNIIQDNCQYGIKLGDANCISISYNTIISPTEIYDEWSGINLDWCHVKNMIGNRIHQITDQTENSSYGIYFIGSEDAMSEAELIANNEIIFYAGEQEGYRYCGMFLATGRMKVINNSIYQGKEMTPQESVYGIYIGGYYDEKDSRDPHEWLEVKNNMIVMEGEEDFAIGISDYFESSIYEVGFNNLYAKNNWRYIASIEGQEIQDIYEWQDYAPDDISEEVYFMEDPVETNLELDDYSYFGCNVYPSVYMDINQRFRVGNTTAMGCYRGEDFSYNRNATLMDLTGNRAGAIAGETDSIKVTLINSGRNSISNPTISWEWNGSKTDTTWTGTLAAGARLVISLGTITYPAGSYSIKVWVKSFGSGSDEYRYDDTLYASGYVCSAPLIGDYEVGSNNADFATLKDFIDRLHICKANGNITLKLQTGTHNGTLDLSGLKQILEGYTLTVTSTTSNAIDATIKPTATAGIILDQSNNVIIKNITVNASALSIPAIKFTGACTNVLIRDCRLLAHPTTTSSQTSAPVYKAQSDAVDSIFFINDTLDGGYYGFYFYGGTGSSRYGTHIVFDSNTVRNQSHNAVYAYFVSFTSCSYNTILSRTSNIYSTWYGLRMSGYNGPLIGNRIIQRSNSITTPCGIYSSSHNRYPTIHDAQYRELIANNEIILNINNSSTSNDYNNGIYTAYSMSEIINNSIYISGSGRGKGILLYNYTPIYNRVIKNNNIIVTSTTAYPIYFYGTGNLPTYDINYNNYAASTIGYYNGQDINNMETWQELITTDLQSMKVSPKFVDMNVPPANLQIANSGELMCDRISSVLNDINGKNRMLLTTMGCYDGMQNATVNAMLTTITGLREGVVSNQTDTVKVKVYNMGTTQLDSINLEWSINGQSQGKKPYSISIAPNGEFATITLGTITYPVGMVEVKVWINELNGGAAADEYDGDDTVSRFIDVCVPFHGVLTVGKSSSSHYKTFGQVYADLSTCGVDGDLTIAFEPDIYNEHIDLSNTTSLLSEHTLTITSTTNDPKTVIFRSPSGSGVVFNNSRNIILKNITIDATQLANLHAIQFTGTCTNITVRDCHLLVHPTTTSSPQNLCVVHKVSGVGAVDSIFFIHDSLDGGYNGFYFSDGIHVVFDSNTVTNSCNAGVISSNVDFISCSYNTILSRTANTSLTWYGLNMNSANGPIIGNRILLRSNSISSPYGIYLNNFNNYIPDTSLVANNEIILNTTSTYYGIHITNTKAKILHNSIYISGTGAAGGIYIANSANNYLVIKNNNIVLTSSSAYPVYFSGTGNLTKYELDYNNYYAPTNIGYYGSARTTLAAWKGQITTDQHSVRTAPIFDNPLVCLELLANNDSLLCPVIADVQSDINGDIRAHMTSMGAYTRLPSGLDLTLRQVSPWNTALIKDQTVSVSVNVDLFNSGLDTILSATFGWSLNGVEQLPAISWTANPPLISREQRNISIGTFQATDAGTVDVVVWIKTINQKQDTVNWNDTVSASSVIFPLAEFVSPFVGDTTNTLSFDVNVKIAEFTGATVNTPEMYVYVDYCNSSSQDTLTIQMVKNNDQWMANIPKQYYNSKVIFEIPVSDTVGNNITLRDTTSILFNPVSAINVYAGNNLAVFDLVSPRNSDTGMCAAISRPVEIELWNLGENDYDFTKDNITIGYKVINPRGIIYSGNLTIDTAKLLSGESKIIELMPVLPIIAGQYAIKAWVTSSIDNFSCDDSLSETYISDLIGLPIDEDFSNSSLSVTGFVATPIIGQEVWTPYFDSIPPSGNGMLRYVGAYGTMTLLSSRQLDLSGSIDPKLRFWYYHDPTASDFDRSYTDVNVIVDGVSSTVKTLTRKDMAIGWKEYVIDLKNYTNGQCILIQFESMNRFNTSSAQYIGRIIITSQPDLAISNIALPVQTVCDLQNAELEIALSTVTNQAIDLSDFSTSLAVDIPGYQVQPVPLQKRMDGLSTDTIRISVPNLPTGSYDIKVYLTSPVDSLSGNDTAYYPVNINPELTVTVNSITENKDCFPKGTEAYQGVIIQNTGNLDIEGVALSLLVTGDNYTETVKEPKTIDLLVGDSILYFFENAYTVPAEATYQVQVFAWSGCDSAKVNNRGANYECADIHDLSLVRIDKPSGQTDIAGSTEYIEISIANASDVQTFSNVTVMAVIEDENGTMLSSRMSIIPAVEPLKTTSFTFTEGYTVPSDSVYFIRVYLSKVDNYPENDTTVAERHTESVGIKKTEGIDVFTLSQNIPNPANNSTRIDYSVPEAGEVIFHVHSISGQLLYSKTIDTKRGTNSIELNTSTFAAGVYFYSMEYKGQRRVKQLIINN